MTNQKIKCWVLYDEEYPGGMIYESRADALQQSEDTRSAGLKAYVRVKYFTREELDAMQEPD